MWGWRQRICKAMSENDVDLRFIYFLLIKLTPKMLGNQRREDWPPLPWSSKHIRLNWSCSSYMKEKWNLKAIIQVPSPASASIHLCSLWSKDISLCLCVYSPLLAWFQGLTVNQSTLIRNTSNPDGFPQLHVDTVYSSFPSDSSSPSGGVTIPHRHERLSEETKIKNDNGNRW